MQRIDIFDTSVESAPQSKRRLYWRWRGCKAAALNAASFFKLGGARGIPLSRRRSTNLARTGGRAIKFQ
jgi:hypothetical protein